MKILITGIEGYIGSLLAPMLMQRGHEVLGVNTAFYMAGWLNNNTKVSAKTFNKDILITPEDLKGVEAVIHMAELSKDSAGLSPTIIYDINHKGSVYLAKLAKKAGVRRFVYMSSCSVYGVAISDDMTEESPVNPQTVYATCNSLVEQDVKRIADDNFSPIFMRSATAFGASPRMRFDTVLNNLAGLAWTTKEIKMTSDGTPWRPLVHALDICKAIVCTLEAPRDIVHNQIFNVGDTVHNYQIKEIAQIVAEIFIGCHVSFGNSAADNRSRVSFQKIKNILPGFKCEWDVPRGAQQLFDLFTLVDLSTDIFLVRNSNLLKQLEYLIRTQQIDKNFFWGR